MLLNFFSSEKKRCGNVFDSKLNSPCNVAIEIVSHRKTIKMKHFANNTVE